ncbi:MAG: InlB B-repeat-containing protein [Spirochaetaceae bacterium]|nr:InlB B-repeat-containing protein [Spirochaetaceae bacterium]
MFKKLKAIAAVTAVSLAIASCNNDGPRDITRNVNWNSIAFGQSVDLTFDLGANAPGQAQMGVNYVWHNPVFVQRASAPGNGTATGNTANDNRAGFVPSAEERATAMRNGSPVRLRADDQFIIESRGGKIAAGQDGLTFLYTELDARFNYRMRGTVSLLHVGNFGRDTLMAENGQVAAGLMVRDTLGPPRTDPIDPSTEETVAISNFTALGVFGRTNAGPTFYGAFGRDGTMLNNAIGAAVSVVETTNFSSRAELSTRFIYEIERTDEGFFTTVFSEDGLDIISPRMHVADQNIATRIDGSTMFWGFFAARGARILVEDIHLERTGRFNGEVTANPHQGYRWPAPAVVNSSVSGETGLSAYTLTLLPNYAGTITISHNGAEIANNVTTTAYVDVRRDVTLTAGANEFTWRYTPTAANAPNRDVVTGSFTINHNPNKVSASWPVIWAGRSASGNGSGSSAANLMTIENALTVVERGQTIYVVAGNYTDYDLIIRGIRGAITQAAVTPQRLNNPLNALTADPSDSLARIMPAPGVPVNQIKFRRIAIEPGASYWHVMGFSAGGADMDNRLGPNNVVPVEIRDSATTHSDFNVLERIIAEFYVGNAGFQVNGTGAGVPQGTWQRGNLLLNTTARYGLRGGDFNQVDGYKLQRVGPGNVLRGTVAHNNEDDGYDLFTNVSTGPSAPILFDGAVAFANGSNGFKFGGEAQASDHILINSIAFDNIMANFSDNFNPGDIRVINATALDAVDQNFFLRVDPNAEVRNEIINSVSVRTARTTGVTGWVRNDSISGTVTNTALNVNGVTNFNGTTITEADFVSVSRPLFIRPGAEGAGMLRGTSKDALVRNIADTINFIQRDGNGDILWGDFLRPRAGSIVDTTGLGALRPFANHSVSFNANGGSGTAAAVTTGASADYIVLPQNSFTPPAGQSFAGWRVENARNLLAPGDRILVNNNLTVYAQWQ